MQKNSNSTTYAKFRHDSPLCMNLFYQEQVAGLVQILNKLKSMQAYNLEHVFDIIWPQLQHTLRHTSGGAILSLKADKVICEVNKEIELPLENALDSEELKAVTLTLQAVKNNEEGRVMLWNYSENVPKFLLNPSQEMSIALSWLCEHPDEKDLFLFLVRQKKNRPFLSYEIQAIKLISEIIGWFVNYTYTHELFLRGIRKQILSSS